MYSNMSDTYSKDDESVEEGGRKELSESFFTHIALAGGGGRLFQVR